jgi:lipopolysaccharide transport system ATP-binding protein
MPVKQYSSGMYLRLAFAVAAHLDTDILLVDEVLAVGDARFQKKCLARMSEVARGGRTVLFVSHNLTAVQGLCRRTIWIDHGRVVADGETRETLAAYLQTQSDGLSRQQRSWPPGQGPSAGGVELRRAMLRPASGEPGDIIDLKTPIELQFDLKVAERAPATLIAIELFDQQGLLLFNYRIEGATDWHAGIHRFTVTIPADLLNDGAYRVTLQAYQNGTYLFQEADVLGFDVLDSGADRNGWFGKLTGILRPTLAWRRELISEGAPQITSAK